MVFTQKDVVSTFLITGTGTVILGGLVLTWIFPIPKPLPDRLERISENAVNIDNDELYEKFDWWHENNPLLFANAARVPFFLQTLFQHFGGKEKEIEKLENKKILDIGCGGGLVTEEIAKQTKAKVIGIDLSKRSIEKARQHSPFPLNRLAYVIGSAYELPFADGSIDAIVCSDVFEHLHDIPLAMREISRVLRKDGILVYDTVNRTAFSWYGTIVIAQNLLRYIPDHSHDWKMYLKPEEMQRAAQQAGLQHAPLTSICGMRPTLAYPWTIMHRLSKGAGMWSIFDRWTLTSVQQASYLSFCVKE